MAGGAYENNAEGMQKFEDMLRELEHADTVELAELGQAMRQIERDVFAAAALQGLLAAGGFKAARVEGRTLDKACELLALQAYALSEAMIKVREEE